MDPVPGKQGGFQRAQVGGQIFHLIELLLVGAEGPLYLTIALWVVRPIEVVWQFEFLDCQASSSQEGKGSSNERLPLLLYRYSD